MLSGFLLYIGFVCLVFILKEIFIESKRDFVLKIDNAIR
jgi:hypothetical protein